MLKNKKAAVEVQFHWIYVMLIGAALLIFFSAILLQQKKLTEEKRNREMLNKIEAAFGNVQSKQGLSQTIEGKFVIKMDCATNSLAIGSAGKQSSSNPIFSSKNLDGINLTLSSVSWDMPFRASNFLLAATNNEQFIIIYDTNNPNSKALFDKIISVLPEKTKYDMQLTDRGAKKVRILFLDVPQQQGSFQRAEDVVRIKVADYDFGNIEFYNGKTLPSNPETAQFVGGASILAALFSDSKEDYGCGMKNAYKKLSIVAEVYEKKAEEFSGNSNLQHCKDSSGRNYYTTAKTALAQIKQEAISTAPNPSAIYSQAENELKPANSELLKKSCPAIY